MKTQFGLLTLFVCILFATKTYSQDGYNYVGIKGGISIPNLTAGSTENPLASGYSSRQGPDFALFFQKGISEKFSVMAQLEYSSQGGKKNGVQAVPTPPELVDVFVQLGLEPPAYVYADFDNEIKLNYLLFSVLGKFSFRLGEGSPLSIYADAGPFGGYMLSAHTVTAGSSEIYLDEQGQQSITLGAPVSFDSTVDIKDQLHTGNFGITGDLGLSFDFGSNRLFIEGGGNYGFVAIQNDPATGKNHTGAATVRIGYAFNF